MEEEKWENIVWDSVTDEDLLVKDKDGETILHKAVNKKLLYKIPQEFLKDELLNQEDTAGYNIYTCACFRKCFDHIPKRLLTEEVLLRNSNGGQPLLCKIIDYDQIQEVPTALLRSGILLKHCEPIDTTYLHALASVGGLKNIPDDIYIDKISIKDTNGENLLHATAEKGRLNDFPITSELEELVKVENKYGETPLHRVLLLSGVPKVFLTKENLMKQNWRGETPIHKSTNVYGVSCLPIEHIDEELLSTKDYQGNTAIDDILKNYKKERDAHTMSLLLKKLSTGFLEKTVKENPGVGLFQGGKEILKELGRRKLAQEVSRHKTLEI